MRNRFLFIAWMITACAIGVILIVVGESRLDDDLDPVSPPHDPPKVSVSVPATPYNPCYAEDEVMVTLEQDAFDMKAGETFCVHHDFLRVPKS